MGALEGEVPELLGEGLGEVVGEGRGAGGGEERINGEWTERPGHRL